MKHLEENIKTYPEFDHYKTTFTTYNSNVAQDKFSIITQLIYM